MDNISLFFLIFGLSNQSELVDNLMTFGAEYIIYLTIILIFVLILKGGSREKKALILAVISIPIVIVLIKLIHLFFISPRPFVDNDIFPLISHKADASFPSRHTSLMSALAFSYLFMKSKWTLLFLLLMFWVGISRIYVGVHYPLDILGGIIVGIVSVLFGLLIKDFFKSFFGFKRPDNL